MASELVRATVRHARHLAEILVVSGSRNADFQVPDHLGGTRGATSSVTSVLRTGNISASAPSANIKQDDVSSASMRCDHKQESRSGGREPGNGDVWIVVVGCERWGGSTDGIADSSVGGEASLSNIGRVGRTAPSSGVNGGDVIARVAANARGVAVRIISDALQLCTDIPPLLLAQALAVASGENANPRRNGDSILEGGTSHALMSRIYVPNTNGTAVSGDIANNHSKCQKVIDIPPQCQRFVFTGVVEALVLSRAFRATTRIIDIAPKTADDTTEGLISAQCRSVSVSSVAFDRTRRDGKLTTSTLPSPPRDLEEETAIRSMAVCDATSFAVARQLKMLHGEAFPTARAARYKRNPVEMMSSSKRGDTACFTAVVTGKPWCCGGDQSRRWLDSYSVGIEDTSGCVDRNVVEEPENQQSSVQRGEPIAVKRSVTTKFIIPFTWGSLAIVQDFPAPEEVKNYADIHMFPRVAERIGTSPRYLCNARVGRYVDRSVSFQAPEEEDRVAVGDVFRIPSRALTTKKTPPEFSQPVMFQSVILPRLECPFFRQQGGALGSPTLRPDCSCVARLLVEFAPGSGYSSCATDASLA